MSEVDKVQSEAAQGKVRLFMLSVLIGVSAGAAASLLKLMIGKVSEWLHPLPLSSCPDWSMLLIPVAGIVLTGIYQRYVLKDNISHGVDKLVNDLASGRYTLGRKLVYGPLIASSLTLGFGGSAGSEGPIAYSGAAIGSNVGRIFKVSSAQLYVLIGCGAGAGIAGIFKAPVGGALFTLEVLGLVMTTVSVIALFAATISSALTAYVLSGFTLDIPWSHNISFDPEIILWVTLLGVFCGIYSVYYSVVMKGMRRVYQSIGNPWVMNVVSGAVLAVAIFVYPDLYGEGYGLISSIINLDMSVSGGREMFTSLIPDSNSLAVVLAGLLLVKCFACSASNSGGGVAGDFAPTLFAGCLAGLFFSTIANSVFGLSLPVGVFAFVGMAGVMSGVIRAPLMALFLTAEMCNGFDYLLPLVVVTLISYGIVMLVTRRKFYEAHLHFERKHRT